MGPDHQLHAGRRVRGQPESCRVRPRRREGTPHRPFRVISPAPRGPRHGGGPPLPVGAGAEPLGEALEGSRPARRAGAPRDAPDPMGGRIMTPTPDPATGSPPRP